MPWARFEDDYLGNRKLTTLSTAAIALDMASIVYSARELRDGRLTPTDVEVIASLIHIRKYGPVIAELLRVHRWEALADCFLIHDYLVYQPSREQVLGERGKKHDAKVRAGQAGGLAKASKRASTTLADDLADAKQNGSRAPSKPLANAKQTPSKNLAPYPVPELINAAAAAETPEGGVGETNGASSALRPLSSLLGQLDHASPQLEAAADERRRRRQFDNFSQETTP